MEMRTLGRTGIKVSPLCLGAMMFGAWGNPDHDDSVRIIHRALDAGINFIDTADVYSAGESEVIVGEALATVDRSRVVLATKVFAPMGDDPNAQGSSRRWIIAECENSLRRLGTDYIDLYQVHRPDETTDLDETLGALSDLVHAGKIRSFGSSTFPAERIVEAQWVAERRGRERFMDRAAARTPSWSGASRRDVLPVAQAYGMGVIPWSPLAGGWLSGRFGAGKENTSRRAARVPGRYDLSRSRQPAQAGDRHRAGHRGRRGRTDHGGAGPGLRAGAPGGQRRHHRAPHHGAARDPAVGARHPPRRRRCSTASTRSCRRGPTSTARTPAGRHRPWPMPGSAAATRPDSHHQTGPLDRATRPGH